MSFTEAELELAFAYHVVQLIVGADKRVTAEENVFLRAHFPDELLSSSGFVAADGALTKRFAQARDEALDVLPRVLGLKEKLELVTTFLGAAVVDEELERNESAIVVAAAQLLGVSNSELDAHLDSLHGTVGAVDLPEPEPEPGAKGFVAEDTLDLE